MSKPIVSGKGTKKSSDIGVFGLKRGGGSGKGDLISSTFSEDWIKSAEEKLAKRRFPCSSCGIMKPEGHCEKCNYTPSGSRGW